jgi:hypothetical protein
MERFTLVFWLGRGRKETRPREHCRRIAPARMTANAGKTVIDSEQNSGI